MGVPIVNGGKVSWELVPVSSSRLLAWGVVTEGVRDVVLETMGG
jgi:hypothetical protein